MVSLHIVDVRKKTSIQFSFKNNEAVKSFIKNISTKDLYMKKYRFEYTKDLDYFLKNNYNKNFFEKKEGHIELKILPNGTHRELKTSRVDFNNRTLKRVINRIKEKSDFIFDVESLKFSENRFHTLHVSRIKNLSVSVAEIVFDKMEWDYRIQKIIAYDEIFMDDIKKTFNENTKNLRQYRKKITHENNTQQ
jgi:hypothetical protein